MTRQVVSHRMMQTDDLDRLRFQLVAAEFLVRMGQRIRERRDELELSRADVARQMPGKVSENQIYRWEKGLHQPQPDTLEALAGVLQCDVAHFVAAKPDRATTPDPFPGDETQLDRIEDLLEKVYALLTGDPADSAEPGVGGLADRLLSADESPPRKAGGRSGSRPGARRRSVA